MYGILIKQYLSYSAEYSAEYDKADRGCTRFYKGNCHASVTKIGAQIRRGEFELEGREWF